MREREDGDDPDRGAQLTVLVPSRGRPEAVRDLQRAWDDTSTGAARLVVVVDDDDEWVPEYTAQRGHLTLVRPRRRLGGTLNVEGLAWARRTWAVGFMGDDHRPRTPGWDADLVDALHDLRSGVVYGNDLYQGEQLPTAVAMTSDLIRILGYMVPPGLVHLFMDDFWRRLGTDLDRLRYLPDVVIEHMHPVTGKAPWDLSYMDNNSADRVTTDRLTWETYLQDRWPGDLQRLREQLGIW